MYLFVLRRCGSLCLFVSMATPLSQRNRANWETFMKEYPPVYNARDMWLRCKWFYAMTGIPWKGDPEAYRMAASVRARGLCRQRRGGLRQAG